MACSKRLARKRSGLFAFPQRDSRRLTEMDGKLPNKNTKGLRRGGGRPKGVPNKTTKAAKDMIQAAADKLGGVDRMVAWAKEAPENERAFWSSIFPRLLPVQVTGEGGGPLQVVISDRDAEL